MRHADSPSLPPLASLSAEDRERQDRMRRGLAERIRGQGGVLGFDACMEYLLHDPQGGYYSHHSGDFSAQGDFVTAPELSPLFASCLARQCEEILDALPPQADILELGAGSGQLAADLLPKLSSRMNRYLIFEPSESLRRCQRRKLREYGDKVVWLECLPDTPIHGVILANEVADALPVHAIVIRSGNVRERVVGLDKDGMPGWQEREAGAELRMAVERRLGDRVKDLPSGYVSEINLRLDPWMRGLSDCLRQGVVLCIDYGYPAREYYHPQRVEGTLLCHYRHHLHADPFLFPGLQDITASVDFSALAHAAADAGFEVRGYASQAWFLLANGLEEELRDQSGENPIKHADLSRQAQTLTLPGEMGERFKAIACAKAYNGGLRGWSLRDQRHFL